MVDRDRYGQLEYNVGMERYTGFQGEQGENERHDQLKL